MPFLVIKRQYITYNSCAEASVAGRGGFGGKDPHNSQTGVGLCAYIVLPLTSGTAHKCKEKRRRGRCCASSITPVWSTRTKMLG